jgi:hypothetical protein
MTDALPVPVAAAVDAANAGDTDAFLATFADDGYVDDWGREFRGADAIRGWSDAEFIGKQVRLDIQQVEMHGREVVVSAAVGGNGFNGPSHFTFAVDGDRNSSMTIRA